MFKNGKSGFGELGHERHCGIDVEEVVIGNFLAVKLVEQLVEMPEEETLLMRVLPIAHCLFAVDCYAECRGLFVAVEIVENRAVIG